MSANKMVSFAFAASLAALLAASGPFTSSQAPRKPQAAAPPGSHRFGLDKPLPRTAPAVRLAAYNTLNVFDHTDDPTLQGEFDDIKFATPIERLKCLARTIREIDADVIALEEVESLEALTWFRDTFLAGAGYDHLASKDAGYFRGVEQSVMSRFPIIETKTWLNESLDHVEREGPGWTKVPPAAGPLVFQRSPLMVTVKISDGYELTVFAMHHKAGRSFGWHREAEALRVVQLIGELQADDPSRNIVVMGDFNCAPWDKSMRVYLKSGLIDTMAYRLIDRDSPESPLYKTHESDRVLDYILMNSAAFREYAPGSGFVYGTVAPPTSYDYQTDPPPAGYSSDHYPVVVDLSPIDRP